jgi:hypothetical protein
VDRDHTSGGEYPSWPGPRRRRSYPAARPRPGREIHVRAAAHFPVVHHARGKGSNHDSLLLGAANDTGKHYAGRLVVGKTSLHAPRPIVDDDGASGLILLLVVRHSKNLVVASGKAATRRQSKRHERWSGIKGMSAKPLCIRPFQASLEATAATDGPSAATDLGKWGPKGPTSEVAGESRPLLLGESAASMVTVLASSKPRNEHRIHLLVPCCQ